MKLRGQGVVRLGRAALVALSFTTAAFAGELTGSVRTAEGKPVLGALVTLTRADGLFVETVYAGADGGYRLRPLQQGKGTLRARCPGYGDATVGVDAAAGGKHDFALTPLTDARALSEQLTASAHFARLPFERPADRQWFQVECLTCHQIGNAFTRMPRSDERWHQIVERMLGFYGVSDAAWIDRYARMLG